jgi:hypothetical protein
MNRPDIRNKKVTPEGIIQDAVITFMRAREWYVKETHGNMYMSGFPDLYCTHTKYGARWIEIKRLEQFSFTAAQLDCFPKFTANGTGIWILSGATEAEYEKLWAPPNWHIYMLLKNHRSANV